MRKTEASDAKPFRSSPRLCSSGSLRLCSAAIHARHSNVVLRPSYHPASPSGSFARIGSLLALEESYWRDSMVHFNAYLVLQSSSREAFVCAARAKTGESHRCEALRLALQILIDNLASSVFMAGCLRTLASDTCHHHGTSASMHSVAQVNFGERVRTALTPFNGAVLRLKTIFFLYYPSLVTLYGRRRVLMLHHIPRNHNGFLVSKTTQAHDVEAHLGNLLMLVVMALHVV